MHRLKARVLAAIAFLVFVGLIAFAGSGWGGSASADTLPGTGLEVPVSIGSEVDCGAFDMTATGFYGCPSMRIVQSGGASYQAMFYNNGGVDHFDPMLTFLRSQGTAEAPVQVQTGEQATPIGVYYYVGPNGKYQQLGALTWRNEGIGDCAGCLWGALDFHLADFTNTDVSNNPAHQRAASLRAYGGLITRPGGDFFVGTDADPELGAFARIASLEERVGELVLLIESSASSTQPNP